jgi:hypothetical protein
MVAGSAKLWRSCFFGATLFLLEDLSDDEGAECGLWFWCPTGAKVVGAVWFMKRHDPVRSNVGQELVQPVASNQDFVSRKRDHYFSGCSLGVNEARPWEYIRPLVQYDLKRRRAGLFVFDDSPIERWTVIRFNN